MVSTINITVFFFKLHSVKLVLSSVENKSRDKPLVKKKHEPLYFARMLLSDLNTLSAAGKPIRSFARTDICSGSHPMSDSSYCISFKSCFGLLKQIMDEPIPVVKLLLANYHFI